MIHLQLAYTDRRTDTKYGEQWRCGCHLTHKMRGGRCAATAPACRGGTTDPSYAKHRELRRCRCHLERETHWCVTSSSHLYVAERSEISATDNTPELQEDKTYKHENYNGGAVVAVTGARCLHAM